MSSSTTTTTLFIFLISLISSASSSSSSLHDEILTAYDVLEQYDFPVGILPKGVLSYEIDRSTGNFAVYFDDSCTFTIQGYNLKYKSKITGTISKDNIKNLSGVEVKILFFWLDIVEVSRDGDELKFSVGIVSAGFEVDNFYESPYCGCGFDCVNQIQVTAGEDANLRNPLVSS